MLIDHGCQGEVELGDLPADIQNRLIAEPGEWLEFDPASGKIVVRLTQPAAGPWLPKITGELVQMLSAVPAHLHSKIPGGDFYIHTLATGQFVRLHVEKGGSLVLRWAHQDFDGAARQAYVPGKATDIDPHVHRLNGTLHLEAEEPKMAAASLQELADSYEGLYPEGHCLAKAEGKQILLEMRDLNLDADLLIERLDKVAKPGSITGHFDLSAFGEARPEEEIRFVFEEGETEVQRPQLWPDESR